MKENRTLIKAQRALKKLLEVRSYDSISVADIAKECGFSRQNFYKNFENKDALVREIVLADIKSALETDILYRFGQSSYHIVEMLGANKRFYLAVLNSSSGKYIERLFFEYICIMFRAFAEYSAFRSLSKSQEAALHFYVAGLIAMFIRFLSGEEKITPYEFTKLIYASVPQTLKMFLTEDGITVDYILYKIEKNKTVW